MSENVSVVPRDFRFHPHPETTFADGRDRENQSVEDASLLPQLQLQLQLKQTSMHLFAAVCTAEPRTTGPPSFTKNKHTCGPVLYEKHTCLSFVRGSSINRTGIVDTSDSSAAGASAA